MFTVQPQLCHGSSCVTEHVLRRMPVSVPCMSVPHRAQQARRPALPPPRQRRDARVGTEKSANCRPRIPRQ